jgi:uncharacterized protein YjbI with pentapeptide repeats
MTTSQEDIPNIDAQENSSDFVCGCEEWMRSACEGLPFYKEMKSAHEDLPFFNENKSYCVLHYPDKEKSVNFKEVFETKLTAKDFNFAGVWFPDEVSFNGFEFDKDVDFRSAIFNAKTDFSSATFKAKAYFSSDTFSTETPFSLAQLSRAGFRSAAYRKAGFRPALFIADVDFNSVTFNAGAYFSSVIFNGETNFSSATFNEAANLSLATFCKVSFKSATFNTKADFNSATFNKETNFNSATFNAETDFNSTYFKAETDFSSAKFNVEANFNSSVFKATTYFSSAIFSKAYFRSVIFNKATFDFAVFKDHLRFSSSSNETPTFTDNSSLSLAFANIEKPERVSFHSVSLRPHWFVNVDPRKFEFTNVEWLCKSNKKSVERELEAFRGNHAHRLLAKACRQLAVNEEESNRYEEASMLRYMAMEVRRLEHWHGFAPWTLRWWYWLASGYGERVKQALVVLIGVWLLFALLYTQVGFIRWEPRISNEQEAATTKRDDVGQPLSFKRAMTHSLSVMALQKPEPKPATNTAHAVVILETILGPLQAALLALAIRRRFMR